MIVYLCGGINALSDSECKDWREEAKVSLKHDTLDPMRRDYRGKERENVREIVENDLDDIAHCDVMLINASRPSWGTAMEIALAKNVRRVAFGIPDINKASPWLLYHCDKVVETLDEAVQIINSW